jgi:hypothetical protein
MKEWSTCLRTTRKLKVIAEPLLIIGSFLNTQPHLWLLANQNFYISCKILKRVMLERS